MAADELTGTLGFPKEARRYPGRHEVVDAVLIQGGQQVPVVVKKFPQEGGPAGGRARRSHEVARALLALGVSTPEPMGVVTLGTESWYVSRRIEGEQVRAWFRHRYEDGVPKPFLEIPFEVVVTEVGRLARRLHDGGVHFRDFTDGNILVRREGETVRLWLVDLDRARVGRSPVGWGARLRDLSRPGVNRIQDRRLLLAAYFGVPRAPRWAEWGVTALRARVRAWDALKRFLRPWRRPDPAPRVPVEAPRQ